MSLCVLFICTILNPQFNSTEYLLKEMHKLMPLTAFRSKESKRLSPTIEGLVVYIHSYLVLRKLLKTLQCVYCILQSPVWSWQYRLLVSEGFIKWQSSVSPAGYLKRQYHLINLVNFMNKDLPLLDGLQLLKYSI